MPDGRRGRGGQVSDKDGRSLVLSGQQIAEQSQADLLNQLRGSTSGEVDEENATDRPCSIYALGATCSGGCLGALYGFGMKVVMHKGQGRLKAARGEALSSAKAFAVFGGAYALANCIIQRLRQKEDAVTSGAAGAVTGFVMGIGGGLQSALASAAMMGAFSLVLDNVGRTAEAEAHSLNQILKSSSCTNTIHKGLQYRACHLACSNSSST